MKQIHILLAGFLLAGCVMDHSQMQNQDNKPRVMFQSVTDKKAVLLQDGPNKRYCVRCGMDLVKFYKTSHAAQKDGKHYQYCSIHCLEDHLGEGVTLKSPEVIDVTSLKFISVMDAHYIVGSSVRGTMSRVSKYAFANIEDAKKFQAEHGGEIMDFNGALKKAKEDFR